MDPFYENQRNQENDYMNRYNTALSKQESYTAMNDRIGKELNLPVLRENAFKMQKMVADTPQVQAQATRGYDVNQNQLDRIIAQRTSELAPAANAAASSAQFAESQLGERLRLGQAENERQLEGIRQEGRLLSDRLAREATGYSQNKQNELTLLLRKMENQQQMTLAEMARVDALAKEERDFERQKQLLTIQYQQEQSRPMTVAPGSSVYNPNTGQFTSAPVQSLFGNISGGGESKPSSSKPMSALDQYITSRGGNAGGGSSPTIASNSAGGSWAQQTLARANQVLPQNSVASANTPLAQYLRARGAMA